MRRKTMTNLWENARIFKLNKELGRCTSTSYPNVEEALKKSGPLEERQSVVQNNIYLLLIMGFKMMFRYETLPWSP